MLQLSKISKIFNMGLANEFVAVNNVDLVIEAQAVTALTGPSGSGKTTLLSLLGCMSRPTSGRITLQGQEITSLPERFLTEIRRGTIGIIFQQFHLVQGLTALENVMLPAYPNGEPYPELKNRAHGLLAELNLTARARERVERLSGGEMQRVAIARALVNDPPILIADEPTAHLDRHLSREFIWIMDKLQKMGKTIIVASHDPLVFESSVVNRVVEMRDGKIA